MHIYRYKVICAAHIIYVVIMIEIMNAVWNQFQTVISSSIKNKECQNQNISAPNKRLN